MTTTVTVSNLCFVGRFPDTKDVSIPNELVAAMGGKAAAETLLSSMVSDAWDKIKPSSIQDASAARQISVSAGGDNKTVVLRGQFNLGDECCSNEDETKQVTVTKNVDGSGSSAVNIA